MSDLVEMRKVTVNLPARDLDAVLAARKMTATELLRSALQVEKQKLAYQTFLALRGTVKLPYIDKAESRTDREIDYTGLKQLNDRS